LQGFGKRLQEDAGEPAGNPAVGVAFRVHRHAAYGRVRRGGVVMRRVLALIIWFLVAVVHTPTNAQAVVYWHRAAQPSRAPSPPPVRHAREGEPPPAARHTRLVPTGPAA
jgi:hypothetical protein